MRSTDERPDLLHVRQLRLREAARRRAVDDGAELGTLIRVELPEFYQRGPDPHQVADALRRQGVRVRLVDQTDLTPWAAGRIVGIGYTMGGIDRTPDYFRDPTDRAARRQLFEEYGIRPGDGAFTVATEVFEGTVQIEVGRFPGQAGVGDDAAAAGSAEAHPEDRASETT